MTIVIVGSDNDPAASVASRHVGPYDSPERSIELLRAYLARCLSGQVPGSKVHVFQDKGDGTQAAGAVACTQANATAGDTVTVAGVVFTVRASPSTDPALGEFAAGADDTACGANFAAAVNAHPRLKGMLTAVNAAGTVTLTAVDKGLFGNLIKMATSDATAFGLTQFTSGAIGTVQTPFRTFRRGL